MKTRPIFLISITPPNDTDVIHLPLLKTVFAHPKIDLDRYEGIILTSKQGVEAMEAIDPQWKSLPVLCVGKATQKHAEALGANVLERSDGYGAGLYDIVMQRYTDKHWLYARPKVVASDFAERLRQKGVRIDEAVVYETVCDAANNDTAIPDDAILIFTSPSALHCFTSRYDIAPSHDLVVIGKTTAKAIDERQRVHLAAEPSVAACIALAKQLKGEPS